MLINISGDSNMSMFDANDAIQLIQDAAGNKANVIYGQIIDDSLEDEIVVTVIATGFDDNEIREPFSAAKVKEEVAAAAAKNEIQEKVQEEDDNLIEIPPFLQRRKNR
jgi:cell division protein FtsZ